MIPATPIEKWYRRVGKLSVGVVLFLILAGGIVRSTGSGMGCPDWPKCFGLWVPPIDSSDIPQSFFELNPEFETKTFVVFQTWIEYINRLLGALTGLVLLIAFVLSVRVKDRRVSFLNGLALLLTGLAAWLGKLVVEYNLKGEMVTVHLLVAMLIVALLIAGVYLAEEGKSFCNPFANLNSSKSRWFSLIVAFLTVMQILLGTQVRESVDDQAMITMGMNRGGIMEALGWDYAAHRVLWIVLASFAVALAKVVLDIAKGNPMVRRLTIVLLSAFAGEVLLGMLLVSFDLPPVLQPLHLLLASIMFAMEIALLLAIFKVERFGNRFIHELNSLRAEG